MSASSYNYLRLSLTDRCNFNCFYCQPALRQDFLSKKELLSTEELLLLAHALVRSGVRHIRLTGGEPFLREDVGYLVEELSRIQELECLSLTTNGFYLACFLPVFKGHQVDKINISLDTLKRKRFSQLTGMDALHRVLDGILRVKGQGTGRAGFKTQQTPVSGGVKLNVVLIRGFNDDEILDFVGFAHTHGVDVRFIEYFPTKMRNDVFRQRFVPTSTVKAVIEEKFGCLESLGRDFLSGPAQYYRVRGQCARLGFISSVTDFFCGACNRLRLTADGKLYLCLYADHCTDLKKLLRPRHEGGLLRAIEDSLSKKSQYNKLTCARSFEMSAMGG